MSGIDYDVDSFNVDTPALPAIAEEEPEVTPGLEAKIVGSQNVLAQRDVNSLLVGIGTLVVSEGLAQARPQKRTGRGLQDDEALKQLATRYVPPPGLIDGNGSALETLRNSKVLVLTCRQHDGGQFSASLYLGFMLREEKPGLVVREELIDQLPADDVVIGDEPALVVADLRDAKDDLQSVRRGLVEFIDEVDEHNSYLILIIPHALHRTFEAALPGRVHHLRKPSSLQVLNNHLDRLNVDVTTLRDQLDALWPPAIADIAEFVRGEEESPEDAILRELASRKLRETPSLREIIREKQKAEELEWLALLLSAALLEGASARHIVGACDLMLIHNKVKRPQVAPLLTPSPYTRLLVLDPQTFAFESRGFRSPGFATELLQHFWREHEDMRDTLLNWIIEIPWRIHDFTGEELERIADRCAEIAAEGGPTIAVALAEAWATTRTGQSSEGAETSTHRTARYRRSIAVRLLITTATDPVLGRKIRDKLLDWSTKGNVDLQVLTTEVCAGIGQDFPRIALTRLKYLAGSGNQDVQRGVLEAMRQIGVDLGASTFLRYLAEWFDQAKPERLTALALSASAVLLESDGDVDADTAAWFWQQALNTMPPEDLRPLVTSWLHAAATAAQGDLVEPLVQATGSDTKQIARMFYASRISPETAGLDEAGTERLTTLINRLHTRLDEIDPIWG